MKTNKSYTKRLKITKRGKILARKAGQNHFNAKEGRRRQYSKKHVINFPISNKAISRFIATAK